MKMGLIIKVFNFYKMFRVIILCIFLNLEYVQVNCQKIMKIENDHDLGGLLIEYKFLPIDKKIHIVLFEKEEQFALTVKRFNGKEISFPLNLDIIHSLGVKASNTSTQLKKLKVFKLDNGFFAIDNRKNALSNPFYVVGSLVEVVYVTNYLLIFKAAIKNNPQIIVECIVSDPQKISELLLKNRLRTLKDSPHSGNRLYLTEDGMCIYLKYSIYQDSTGEWKMRSPLDMVIYENFELFHELGEYTFEDLETSPVKFGPFEKRILVNETGIRAMILDRETVVKLLQEHKMGAAINKLKEGSVNFILINDKLLTCSFKNLFFLFENEGDFNLYRRESLKLADNYNYSLSLDELSISFNSWMSDHSLHEGERFSFPQGDEKGIVEDLEKLDSLINQYFFDDSFISKYFPIILGQFGILLENKKLGHWEYDHNRGRYVLKLIEGEIDIIPYLVNEFKDQRYTGFCSISTVFDGLKMGRKLNVLPGFLK